MLYNFFEKHAFKIYKEVVNILHKGKPIIDEEVKEFIDSGDNTINFLNFEKIFK